MSVQVSNRPESADVERIRQVYAQWAAAEDTDADWAEVVTLAEEEQARAAAATGADGASSPSSGPR